MNISLHKNKVHCEDNDWQCNQCSFNKNNKQLTSKSFTLKLSLAMLRVLEFEIFEIPSLIALTAPSIGSISFAYLAPIFASVSCNEFNTSIGTIFTLNKLYGFIKPLI